MNVYEIFPEISALPFFSDASKENVIRYLTDDAICVNEFTSGDIIYSPTTSSACVGILIDGSAKVHPYGCEDKTLLKKMSVGDIFGIANLYAENSRFPSVIIANKEAKVLFINGDAFKNFIENDTIALKNYLNFLSKKIIYLNKKISTFTAGNADCKLALYLIENNENGKLNSTLSMSALASTLGVGRASLYRAFDKLENANLIKKDGMDIFIIDSDGLLSLTACDPTTQF